MRRTFLLLAVTVFLCTALMADEFILKSGNILFGKLVGIKDNYMYVLDDGDQLIIISFDQIEEIETYAGKVFDIWSKRKPFMKIDPSAYTDRTTYIEYKKEEDSSSSIQAEISDLESGIQLHKEPTYNNVPREKTSSQSFEQNKPTTQETHFYSIEVGVNPISKHPVSFDSWALKWGKTEKPTTVYRLKPLIDYDKDRVKLEDDGYIASTEMMLLGLEIGFEHHKYFSDRYSPYLGLVLHGTYHNGQYEYTDENGVTYETIGVWLNNKGGGTGYWKAGVALVSGFDFYINNHISLGVEIGYGVSYISNMEITTKRFSNSSTQETVISDEASRFSVGRYSSGLIRLGFAY